MYGRPNALASYGRIAGAETNPIQQIVMLYDGAIKFLRLAAASIESNDIPAKAEQVDRALDILGYLQAILDFERGGDVAANLDALYTVVTMNIVRASARLDADEMRRSANLLTPVRDSWLVNARVDIANSVPAVASPPFADAQQSRIAFAS